MTFKRWEYLNCTVQSIFPLINFNYLKQKYNYLKLLMGLGFVF
jgi:hypothetical protein